jgi:hypothetical protein
MTFDIVMKRLRLPVAFLLAVSLNIGSMMNANSAATYTLKLTFIEKSLEGVEKIYVGESPSGYLSGIEHCSLPNRYVGWSDSTSKAIYAKIGKTTKIKVLNESKRLLALATLSKVDWLYPGPLEYMYTGDDGVVVNAIYGNCAFSQSIKLGKSKFYTLEFSGLKGEFPTFDYSFAELVKKKWTIIIYA